MSEQATQDSPYIRLGREEGILRLVEHFYDIMDKIPEAKTIRAMHKADMAPMIDKLTVFLTGWMGGPERYNERFGRIIIPAVHEPYSIGSPERDAWVLCMHRALEAVEVQDDLIEMLIPSFTQMAEMCRTRED